MGEPRDILKEIRDPDDPRKLVEVVREIDANGDRKMSREELTSWVWKHKDELNVGGHTLGDDLRAEFAAKTASAKPPNINDYRDKNGVVDQDAFRKAIADFGGLQNDATAMPGQSARSVRIDRELATITEELQDAITAGSKRQYDAHAGEDEQDAKDKERFEHRLAAVKKRAEQTGNAHNMVDPASAKVETENSKSLSSLIAQSEAMDDERPKPRFDKATEKQIADAREVLAQYSRQPLVAPDLEGMRALNGQQPGQGQQNQR